MCIWQPCANEGGSELAHEELGGIDGEAVGLGKTINDGSSLT
jgi:hypothetical protein